MVRPKWVKGKQCMSTQVSAKQREQHAAFDDKYPATLSFTRRRPPRLSFCKWWCREVEEGRRPCRGHRAHEPWGWGGVSRYFLLSVQRPLRKALRLCQTLPFYFSYPISHGCGCCAGALLMGFEAELPPSWNPERSIGLCLNSHVGSMTFDLERGMRLDGLERMEQAAIGTIEQNAKFFFFLPPRGYNRMFSFLWLCLSFPVCLSVLISSYHLGHNGWQRQSGVLHLMLLFGIFQYFRPLTGLRLVFQETDEANCCASWSWWGRQVGLVLCKQESSIYQARSPRCRPLTD